MSDSAAFIAFSADYAFYSFVAIMTSSLFYGIFLVLTVISLGILWKRPQELSRPLKILRWTIICLAIITTAIWAFQSTADFVLTVKWRHLASSELPLEDHIAAIDKAELIPIAAATVLRPFAYVIADAIPIWRAYVLWTHSKLVQSVLLFAFFLNAALCIAQTFVGPYLVARVPKDNHILTALYAAQLFLSTITNAIATTFIGVMAWRHKTFIREHQVQKSSLTSSGLHILLLLVEAGALLCFAQTINVVLSVLLDLIDTSTFSNPLSLAQLVFSDFGDAVAAAYPSLMVIILSLRGSALEDNTTLFPNSANDVEAQQGGRLTTIEFAQVESLTSSSLSTSQSARESNKEVHELRESFKRLGPPSSN
ncbi:hypothetical protein DL96DRAFT_1589036 [Flagelloscypha sp. PMI_526]|nr:hypothetical protein DL96DRAFT_1589036 [Flagelloscypha sp. PMI_526]